MLPVLQIGPLAIPTPEFILLIGLWVGLTIAERRSSRHKVNKDVLFTLAMIILITGIVAARLGYVARYPSAFLNNPADIFSPNMGLLDPFAGVFIACLAGLIYLQKKNLFIPTMMDALTPVLGVMGVALGLAHLASGDAYGYPTTIPWGITMWGATRHPSQIYEILAATIILAFILSGKTLTQANRDGELFVSYLAMTAFARLFLEAFRGDSQLFIYGIRSAQLISWLVLAACFIILTRFRTKIKESR